MPPLPHPTTATVIIATFSLDRWDLLAESVESVKAQTCPPVELIICVDHNDQLLQQCQDRWGERDPAVAFPILVVPNRFEQSKSGAGVHEKAHGTKRRFGAGLNRNTGAELASGDVLVFMDDDAVADPTWLEHLLAPYDDPHTVAVGGAPLPRYETERPRWFPANFDWVFGCVYAGLPMTLAPYPRLIGASLSVRRKVFEEIGGFHSIDLDDLDLCLRLPQANEMNRVMYQPRAVVHHFVPSQRVSWQYFWRRCYFINREKVQVFADVANTASLQAESQFVVRAITAQLAADADDVLHGRFIGIPRIGAMFIGILMAAVGHFVGRSRLALHPPTAPS
jgi:GT2 family glycosyltransferase